MALLKDFRINFRAPALPYAPTTYIASAFEAFNNVLRLYFNQVDQSLKTVNDKASRTWTEYAGNYSSAPTLLTTITDGDVYEYTYADGTAYRLVPSGSEEDAFYSTFSGGVLSDKIVGRGMNI
jgi:hypothetical protein